MRTLILYESAFGNTAQLAQVIGTDLRTLGTVEVADVQAGAPSFDGIEFLVVCGPTQAHGVSPALRTLLDHLPDGALKGIAAAAFDTRVSGPRWLTGAASIGIAKRLKHKGARLVMPAESFIVDGREGPLAEDEIDRAHVWVAGLVSALASTSPTPAPVRA
jgi:flavodoxin